VRFYYFNGNPYTSAGHPVQNVIVNGDSFVNNGSRSGPGVMALGIGASQIANSDIMREFTITNSIFSNNNNIAIGADTARHLEDIHISSSNRFSGDRQKLALNENIVKIIRRSGSTGERRASRPRK
jgi:hypothetical protein